MLGEPDCNLIAVRLAPVSENRMCGCFETQMVKDSRRKMTLTVVVALSRSQSEKCRAG
jgi:hypothetical protein